MSDRLAVMNDGKFEQVGPPEEVYNDPDSRFVADFLGTANIFDGSVTAVDDGNATVDCADVTLRATARNGVSAGDEVSVVVRPERVRFEAEANTDTATNATGPASADGGSQATDTEDVNVFEGEITFKRHLGSSVEFHLETDVGRELVVVRRSGMDKRGPGDRATVSIAATECRIVEE